jgi:predicted transcriptional regulator of viral defense system
MFNSRKVFVRRIKPKMFFGISTSIVDNFDVPVSDIEKTFIDMIYFRYNVDDYVYERLIDKCNKKRLDGYLKHYSKRFRKTASKLVSKYGM